MMHGERFLEISCLIVARDFAHGNIWMSIAVVSREYVMKTDLTFSILI